MRLELTHVPMWTWLLVLVGVLPFFLARHVLKKTAIVTVALCSDHGAAHSRAVGVSRLGVGLLVAGLVLAYGTGSQGSLIVLAAAPLAMFAGSRLQRPLRLSRMDEDHVWIGDVHATVLDDLPVFPRPLG